MLAAVSTTRVRSEGYKPRATFHLSNMIVLTNNAEQTALSDALIVCVYRVLQCMLELYLSNTVIKLAKESCFVPLKFGLK